MSNIETQKSTVCLNMIVKNEAHVIKRCLESVLPYIDTWVISDTGSTDGTQDIIREVLKDIPGELIEREWIDFSHNRNQVLQHAKDKADYSFIIDADETIHCDDGFNFNTLKSDAYYITNKQPRQSYSVLCVVKNTLDWRWEGVLHESMECEDAETYGHLEGLFINVRQEGARSLDPNTYKKDAAILTRALAENPDNARYQFYLAQSLRDAHDLESSILHYQHRVDMGGWQEEVYCSKYQIAMAMETLGKDWKDCMEAYLDAWQHTPSRAEPLYRIGSYYMREQNWPLAWLFISQAAAMPVPEDQILFVEKPIYDYMAIFDSVVVSGQLGQWQNMEALQKELLTRPMDEEHLKIAKSNYDYFKSQENGTQSEAA